MEQIEQTAYTSVQTIAEILQGRMEPAMRDSGRYEIEDLEEEVRNAYAGVLWKIHMQFMSDGDRTALESLLQQKYYDAKPDTKKITLQDAMVVDLPRDAGIYTVMGADKDQVAIPPGLTKTTPAMAIQPKSKIDPGKRYYRIGRELYFPDGLPRCTAFVLVIFYGLDTEDPEAELIPRDYADMVRDKIWNALYPSAAISADITNNQNPNG
jgi:hypothetical protein